MTGQWICWYPGSRSSYMLKARPMSRLFIAASKEQLEPVIKELYRHNLFHIDEFVDQTKEGYEGFRIGMPLAEASPGIKRSVKDPFYRVNLYGQYPAEFGSGKNRNPAI